MHRHTPDEERVIRDAALDETLEGTFPASDPLSTTPDPDDDEVLDRAGPDGTTDGPAVPARPRP